MANSESNDESIRVQDYLDRGDAIGWFDAVYNRAHGDGRAVPWARLAPRPALTAWLDQHAGGGAGQRALVIGCGLGDDAEALAAHNFAVTASDISPTAIAWCQRRFPDSSVNYQVADLFDPPAIWHKAFDLVLEDFTVQALPIHMRSQTIAAITHFVAPAGRLLVICIGAEEEEERSGPPWPLTRAEVERFQRDGLSEVRFDRLPSPDQLGSNRWRIEFQRQTG